jgi:hypothetical protein
LATALTWVAKSRAVMSTQPPSIRRRKLMLPANRSAFAHTTSVRFSSSATVAMAGTLNSRTGASREGGYSPGTYRAPPARHRPGAGEPPVAP